MLFIHTQIDVVHFIRESTTSKCLIIRGYQIGPLYKKLKHASIFTSAHYSGITNTRILAYKDCGLSERQRYAGQPTDRFV